jgi:beta-glucanase (GH16 family)
MSLAKRAYFVVLMVLAVGLTIALVVKFYPGNSRTKTAKPKPTPVPHAVTLPGKRWQLVFNDSFNERHLNTRLWSTCWKGKHFPPIAPACTNYQEAELYRSANVSVSHGMLHLTARRQINVPRGWNQTYHYVSGMVTTASHRSFRYGMFQVKIMYPKGHGLWTTFWLRPSDMSWPPEIDMAEHYGVRPTGVMMAYHWNKTSIGSKNLPTYFPHRSLESQWHTYTTLWQPGLIRWYVDGVPEQTYRGPNVTSKKMALNLTFAVNRSASIAGQVDNQTHFPSTVLVKWVRVWKKQ